MPRHARRFVSLKFLVGSSRGGRKGKPVSLWILTRRALREKGLCLEYFPIALKNIETSSTTVEISFSPTIATFLKYIKLQFYPLVRNALGEP